MDLDEEELKVTREIKAINEIIAYLENIKKAEKNEICIDFVPEIIEIGSTSDGTMYGKKHLKIDITFEQLYTKNEFDFPGEWKLSK